MDYKKYIAEKLQIDGVSSEEIYETIALPPNTEMGDYAIPCFKFAKIMRKSPVMIAESLKESFQTDDVVCEVSAVNGYLNFKINKTGFVKGTLDKIFKEKDGYGSAGIGAGKGNENNRRNRFCIERRTAATTERHYSSRLLGRLRV